MNVLDQTAEMGQDAPDAVTLSTPPPVDAIIRVTTDKHELEAYLYIEPPNYGGAAPTCEAMQAALSEYGISHNVDLEKLKALETAPVYRSDIPVAQGVAPVDGVDGTASFKIRTEKTALKPKEREDGSVDYYDLGIAESVTQGQVLCVITRPTEGTPGISVKGKALAQRKGRPVPSYLGTNTELGADGLAILSKINGEVSFTGNSINVQETFYVKGNVDTSTGNIKVIGNLVVSGMVMPGLKIESGGNIDVRGTVEAATIKAAGSITLHSGVIGSNLSCDGDLRCQFVENCTLFVKGDIKAEYMINSDTKCGKSIKVVGMRAKIIGGSYVAGQDIEAQTIGSPAGVVTKLELGSDSSVIERQQELLARAAQLETSIKNLSPLITILRQLEAENRLPPEKRELLDNVGYSYDTSTSLLEEAKRELVEITQLIKIRGYGRIQCSGTIHQGTRVAIGEASLFIKEDLQRAMLYYKDGAVCAGTAPY
ncbi:MAG TPA: FapA family protein [Terriglobales bacterium]|nr:FapA family protein [Terriglobales bacterium]